MNTSLVIMAAGIHETVRDQNEPMEYGGDWF